MPKEMTSEEFGLHIKAVREALGLTLRDVEERTDRIVKNGYLSQIEKGLIRRPSPAILYQLAQAYKVSYQELLIQVGHRVPDEAGATQLPPGLPLDLVGDLTEEERKDLLEYVAYIRHRRKGQ
jgi:HTH-type transcriptional regulator, competence development regulator